MDSMNLGQQHVVPQRSDDPSRGLDYELWIASRTVTIARQRLAEFQAAFGETQLECRRLTRECETLQILNEGKSDGLVHAWEEYKKLKDELSEQTAMNEQLSELLAQKTQLLQDEICYKEMLESSLTQYRMCFDEQQLTIEDKQRTIRKLDAELARYMAITEGLRRHFNGKAFLFFPGRPIKPIEGCSGMVACGCTSGKGSPGIADNGRSGTSPEIAWSANFSA